MNRNQKVVTFSIYLIFLFLFALLSAELYFRFDSELGRDKKKIEWLKSMMTYDPLLGWKHVPLTKVRSQGPEYDVWYEINSKGLRDQEHAYQKPKGTFRILCLGDSITFGWGVNAEARFSDQLKSLIHEPDIEIINAGVQGYGIDQELLYLQEELLKYEPDLVLLYVIPDDVKRACYSKMFGRPKPRFAFQNGTWEISNVPVPKADLFSFENPMLERVRFWLARKSYFFYFLQNKFYLMRSSRAPSLGDESRRKELSQFIFFEMKKALESRGAKLVIVGDLPELAGFFKEIDVDYLPDPLLDFRGDPHEIYFKESTILHPNACGHRILAEGLGHFIRIQIKKTKLYY